MLQRCYNSQRLILHTYGTFRQTPQFLQRLSAFNNIQNLDLSITSEQLKILQVLVQRCGKQLKTVQIATNASRLGFHWNGINTRLKLPVFNLPNAANIHLGGVYFPIIFSNKLTTLTLYGGKNSVTCINPHWFKFTADNCRFTD